MNILKLFLISILLIFGAYAASAAMPPSPSYCEHMGYNYTHVENGSQSEGICQFNENESCEAGEFLEGECGREHVRNISCRTGDEAVFTEFESCCGDMEPYLPPGAIGQPTCQQEKSLVQDLSDNLRFYKSIVADILLG